MKNLDWIDLLRHHPIFSGLEEKIVVRLLHDDVSLERRYALGAPILREGEVGNSVSLIGAGSVEVVLEGEAGERMSLAVLKRGEVFGEMAFFEGKPRSATVMAREECTILEIKGSEFGTVVEDHPDIELKLLLTMSDRLRHADGRILREHMKSVTEQVGNVEDRLKRFEEKLDLERKAIDASLRGAQAIFDQTKLRTDEVINAADRSKSQFTSLSGILLAVLSLAGGALGLFGYKELREAKQFVEQTRQVKTDAEKVKGEVEVVQGAIKQSKGEIDKSVDEARRTKTELEAMIDPTRKLLVDMALSGFPDALAKNQILAHSVYNSLRRLDPSYTGNLLMEVQRQITASGQKPRDYRMLLGAMLEDARTAATLSDARPADRSQSQNILWSHYLLLANTLLVAPPEQFSERFRQLEEDAPRHRTQQGPLDSNSLRELDRFFEVQAPRQRNEFRRVVDLMQVR